MKTTSTFIIAQNTLCKFVWALVYLTAFFYTPVTAAPTNTSSNTYSSYYQSCAPDLEIRGRRRITCSEPTTILRAISRTVGVTFAWTGPGGFTSNIPNPTISAGGTYTVVVTNPANGCSASDTAFVNQNFNQPRVTATGAIITCANRNPTINASSPNATVYFTWTGPGGFTSNIPNPAVSVPGTYTVTGTNPGNGCSTTISVVVTENTTAPPVTASGATITCQTAAVVIQAQSPLPTIAYSWTGPGGFTANIPNPTVTVPGTYTVTATNTANGCSSSATTVVAQNTTPPTVTITGRRRINCTNPTTVLTATSNVSTATFRWTGPGGFTSNVANPTISAGGLYTVIATDPANGCTARDTATVNANFNPPTVTGTGGRITCTAASVTLNATASPASVTFAWTGPGGFSSTIRNPSVTTAGVYTITVTNPNNGCTASDTAVVRLDTARPVVRTTGGTITCSSPSVVIVASATPTGVTYAWTGPGGFTSTIPNPRVSVAGTYTVTVTNPGNGCTRSATAVVNQNTTAPTVSITGRRRINCGNPTTVLTARSNVPTATFSWTGPGGFTSNIANPTISVGGQYTVVATDPANGCTATDTAFVNQNFNNPRVNATGATITCTNPSPTVSATSPNVNVTFSWTGPGGFTSNIPNPVVTVPGFYIVTGTNTNNGCSTSVIVQVVDNTTPPACSITVPTPTPPANSTKTLSTPVVANRTYSWSVISTSAGWGISGSSTNSTVTITTGAANTSATVVLVVTNTQNGCTSTCRTTLRAAARIAPSARLIDDGGKGLFNLKHANPLTEHGSFIFSAYDSYKATME